MTERPAVESCPQCGRDLLEDSTAGFCNPYCRSAFRAAERLDERTDWFSIRLRQHIVRECWTRQEEKVRRHGPLSEQQDRHVKTQIVSHRFCVEQ